jgi:protein-disulfide isomerase
MSSDKSWVEKIVPVLVVVIIVMAFGMGALWSKVQTLSTGTTTTTAGTQQAQGAARPTVSEDNIKALFNDKNIFFGDPAKAKNLLVEAADPSCPYCHVAAGHNPELNRQMGGNFILSTDGGTYVAPVIEMKKLVDSGDAAFVWLYTPGHGNGELASKALYCSHEQGKFWPAHDKMMTNAGYTLLNDVVKNDLTKAPQLVQFLGNAVNGTQLQACLDSGKFDGELAEDTAQASALGISGTPGFFVNTTNFAGAYSWNDMKSAVK